MSLKRIQKVSIFASWVASYDQNIKSNSLRQIFSARLGPRSVPAGFPPFIDELCLKSVGVQRPKEGPTILLLRWTSWLIRPLPLAGHHRRSWGLSLRRRFVLLEHPLPSRLPIQATKSLLRHQNLPPKHQLPRVYLPRHPQGPVVPSLDYLQGSSLNQFSPHRRQPWGPSGARDRSHLQDRHQQVQSNCQRMD